MPWNVTLDPPAVAPDRVELDLNDWAAGGSFAIHQAGIDWSGAAIDQFLADQIWGSSPVDYRVPNRIITIPLFLGCGTFGTLEEAIAAQEAARQQLAQKVALLQAEGGQLLRQRDDGDPMYADIVNATLTLPDTWGETGGIEDAVTLTLDCLPDFYGDEITLDLIAATGHCNTVLKWAGDTAQIQGDYPGRARIIVKDTSGHDQLGLLWGLRARHYDPASTAALVYEAEALTAVNAASGNALAGASGGNVVKQANLPGGSWVSFLTTNLASGGAALTHTGSYRVWVRAFSAAATPQLRLVWGAGSLAVPTTNDAVIVPGAGAFYMLDLGEIRIDAPPVGANSWVGAFQALAATDADTVSIDIIYLQPLDEAAGLEGWNQQPPASSITATHAAASGSDDAATGTLTWGNPEKIEVQDNSGSKAFGTSATTHWLKASSLGFAIPTAATVTGITVAVSRLGAGIVRDAGVRLIKAGTIQATDKKSSAAWPGSYGTASYGGDLWGGTWTPSDINNAGFGVALSAVTTASATADVDYITVTIGYTFGSGFTISQDAVIYASQTAELRYDGMVRTDPTGTVYGPISQQIGDLVRIPPSRMESRAVELFVKPTRGDVDPVPDAGLDGFTAQVVYRPCFLSRI